MPKLHQIVPIISDEKAETTLSSAPPTTAHFFQTYTHSKKVIKTLIRKSRPKSAQAVSSSFESEKPFWNTQQSNVQVVYGATQLAYSALDLQTIEARFVKAESDFRPLTSDTIPKSSHDNPFDHVKATRIKNKSRRTKNHQESTEVSKGLRVEAVPEWIALRESHLNNLELTARQVLLRQNDNSLPTLRQSFMHNIALIQRLTLRIIEFYIDNLHFHTVGTDYYQTEEKWQSLVAYVQTLPTCLNWLEENPFRLWCGLHLANNPLAAAYDMHNDLAIMLNDDLRQLLASSGEIFTNKHILGDSLREPKFIPALQAVIAKELRYDEDVHHRIVKANQILQVIHNANSMQHGYNTVAVEKHVIQNQPNIDLGRHLRLSFLLFGCDKQAQLDSRGVITQERNKYYYQKIYLQYWRRCLHNEMCILIQRRRRQTSFCRQIFKRLKYEVQRHYKLQELRNQSMRRYQSNAIDTWQASILYLKRYRQLQARCNLTVMHVLFDRWRLFLDQQVVFEEVKVVDMFEWRYSRLVPSSCYVIASQHQAKKWTLPHDEEGNQHGEQRLLHLEQMIIQRRTWRHWHRQYTISTTFRNLFNLTQTHLKQGHFTRWQHFIEQARERECKARAAREQWDRDWMDYEETCTRQWMWEEERRIKHMEWLEIQEQEKQRLARELSARRKFEEEAEAAAAAVLSAKQYSEQEINREDSVVDNDDQINCTKSEPTSPLEEAAKVEAKQFVDNLFYTQILDAAIDEDCNLSVVDSEDNQLVSSPIQQQLTAQQPPIIVAPLQMDLLHQSNDKSDPQREANDSSRGGNSIVNTSRAAIVSLVRQSFTQFAGRIFSSR